jgi:hypothetical protein
MGSPLAFLYSSIDSAKRKVMDALANPVDTWKNGMDDANLGAKKHLEQLATMPMPGQGGQPNQAVVDDVLNAVTSFTPAGILAGPRAKGIDNVALAYAMKDLRAGRKPDEIWADRNWAKGPDGFWRTEIDDSKAAINAPYGPAQKYPDEPPVRSTGDNQDLSTALHFPKFAEAYPDIYGNSTLTAKTNPYLGKGYQEGMFMRYAGGQAGGQLHVRGGTPEDTLSVTLHELQHAVQRKEGFAGGGNPNMFKTNDPQAAFKLYQRLGGEAESRLVQERMNLSPVQRRMEYPYDPDIFKQLTGVPLDQLILSPAP